MVEAVLNFSTPQTITNIRSLLLHTRGCPCDVGYFGRPNSVWTTTPTTQRMGPSCWRKSTRIPANYQTEPRVNGSGGCRWPGKDGNDGGLWRSISNKSTTTEPGTTLQHKYIAITQNPISTDACYVARVFKNVQASVHNPKVLWFHLEGGHVE